MPSEETTWYLKKHGNGEIHGPVSFDKILTWANAAHINPQDLVSNDGKTWNKAPMIADLGMDWLLEVPDNPLYGPTSPGAVLEFYRSGEITDSTVVVNCCTGDSMMLSQAPFFRFNHGSGGQNGPVESLLARLSQLEEELQRTKEELDLARKTIASLHSIVGKIDAQKREQGVS